MRKFSIIAAVDEEMGIGKNNALPWYCPEDLRHFKKLTIGNIVIMGVNTWKSLKGKPLLDRTCFIYSKEGPSFNEILSLCAKPPLDELEEVWVIGGGKLYEMALKHSHLKEVVLTRIKGTYDCDVFFKGFAESDFKLYKQSDISENAKVEWWRKRVND
jgi:dihydrofolate reductase